MKVIFVILIMFIAGVYNCNRNNLWPSIQLVAPQNTTWTRGIYYDESGFYRYVDTMGSSCYLVNGETGETKKLYLKKIENLHVAFDYPLKSDSTRGVIGASNKIFPYKIDPSTNTITFEEPVTVTNDVGYYIHEGHADSKGRLTIIMNSKADKKHRSGRLYTFDNRTPVLTKQFKTDGEGFVLSHDEKTMYIIKEYGRIIYKFNYNINNGGISNAEKVFEMKSDLTEGEMMTGIEIDSNDDLYVTTNFGFILYIRSNDGIMHKYMKSTVTYMTGITFGPHDNSGLYITTTKHCHNKELIGGGILHVYGINKTGIPDYPVEW